MSVVPPPSVPPLSPPERPTRRVSRRVVQGLLSMGVFLIAVSGLALYDLGRFHRELTSLAHSALPQMTIASELSSQLQLLVNQVERLSSADTHPARRIAREDIDLKFHRIKEYVTQVETVEGAQTLANLLASLEQTVADLDAQVARRIDVAAGVDRAQTTVSGLSDSLKGLTEDTLSFPPAGGPAPGPESLRSLVIWISTLDGVSGQAVRASRMQRLVDIRQSEQQVRQTLNGLDRYHRQVPPAIAARLGGIEEQMEDALFADGGLYPALVERVRVSSRAAGLGSQTRLLVEEVSKLSRDMFATITARASANATSLWNEVERQAVILTILAIVAVGAAVGVYFYFRHFLTNRLSALNDGVLGRIAGRTTRIDDGGQDEISAIARSITYFLSEISRRQEDVETRERQFRSMVQGSVQAVLVLSADRVLFANPAFSQMFALPDPAEAVPVRDLLPDAVWPLVNAPADAFAQGAQILDRLPARRDDGSSLWVTIAVSPIHWQGQEVRQITVLDVTQPVLAEATLKEARDRAEEAARVKSRFMATMSHEIRTPMNAILGLSHLTLKTSLTAQQRNYLNKLHSSAGVLLAILNDILDFSKIEAGKMELENKPFDLSRVLDTVSTIVALHAADKSLEFLYDIPADVPYHLRGDALRLEQILLNLTNNAVKFTDQGEVVLAIRVIHRSENRVELSFAVRDTGIGIHDSQRDRLFAAFAQADSSATRRFGGTGLGLAISRQLAEIMGGNITVTSTYGAGSVFTLTLPLELAAPPVSEEAAPLPPDLPVLVAEDNPTACALLVSLLTDLGVRALPAGSPAEALQQLPAAAGGIILVDKGMTDPSGTQPLSRTLQQHCQSMTSPPPLILLGYHGHDADEEQPETLARAGIHMVLHKPLDRTTLRLTLHAALTGGAGALPPALPQDAGPGLLLLQGVHVLLAEDTEINQLVARELLESAGATVDVVTTGLAAVERALHSPQPPDVVLMDVQMPEMDGVEATRRIRRVLPSAVLPILAITAHTADLEYARCVEAGVDDYLMKPVPPDRLIAAIHAALRQRPAQTAPADRSPLSPAAPPVLPERIGPFDLTAARLFTDGREDLLTRLLLSFRDRFTPLLTRLTAADPGDRDSLIRDVHSLKSAARTLGNTALGDAAATLEDILQRQDDGGGPAADHCHAHLQQALTALTTPLPPAPAPAARGEDSGPQPPLPDSVIEQLTGLRHQISSNRLTARSTFADLRPVLSAAGLPDEDLNGIHAALDSLDFNAAGTLLDRLMPPKKVAS